jgi:hypothetical protein
MLRSQIACSRFWCLGWRQVLEFAEQHGPGFAALSGLSRAAAEELAQSLADLDVTARVVRLPSASAAASAFAEVLFRLHEARLPSLD